LDKYCGIIWIQRSQGGKASHTDRSVGEEIVRIDITSVLVDDQAKALKFYTEKLGFRKMADIPVGEYRWLTVTSAEGPDGVELSLEPMGFPEARIFQKALYDAGTPYTAFRTDDIDGEYRLLKSRGVKFRGEPQVMGPIKSALFEDTCGNLINLVQPIMRPEK
jgi:catechol 2,3-dioxygenase-like lactoylglutathione lyase family enzyme